MEAVGCIYQERHGYERPGWFNAIPSPVQPYEWYGAYDTPNSKDSRYKVALSADYTFDFPPFKDTVNFEIKITKMKYIHITL